ncbi:hypothetical protein PIB30_010037 [Stylosanthes scabra]|uniref:Uncharacterized protein n=1 Tax=Stylosanthes scabra TaxID=79078 RepID=A0ABU6W3E0_9FABA|nr:hypothetical protein [Stylosanthes scabra]
MKEIAHSIVNTRPRVRQTSELFEAIRSLGVQDDKLFEAIDWLAEHPTSIDAVSLLANQKLITPPRQLRLTVAAIASPPLPPVITFASHCRRFPSLTFAQFPSSRRSTTQHSPQLTSPNTRSPSLTSIHLGSHHRVVPGLLCHRVAASAFLTLLDVQILDPLKPDSFRLFVAVLHLPRLTNPPNLGAYSSATAKLGKKKEGPLILSVAASWTASINISSTAYSYYFLPSICHQLPSEGQRDAMVAEEMKKESN